MRIIVALFVVLWVFVLSVSLLGFILGKIASLSFWNGCFWTHHKKPIITLCVAGSLVLFFLWARATDRRHLQDAQDYAQRQGWAFAMQDDSDELKQKSEALLHDRRLAGISRVRTVETGDRTIHLFDCNHKHRNALSNVHDSPATCCLVQSDRFKAVREPFVVSDYLLINETLIGEKVRMAESSFSEMFIVRSMNPAAARTSLNRDLQGVLVVCKKRPLDNSIQVAIGPSGVLVPTPETFDHACWQALIDLAINLEGAIG